MSATTILPHIGPATPWLLSPKSHANRAAAEDVDATPLALDRTPPALREAVRQFSEAFESLRDQETFPVVCAGSFGARTLISNTSFSGPVLIFEIGEASRMDPERADALAVFNSIQDQLAVTQKELLIATGIRRRTYYSWRKSSTPRPRLSSLGRLWQLADALADLRETLERPIAAWLHTSPERMLAFKEGRFEDLVDLAVTMPKPSQRAHGKSRRIGIAADVDVPIVKTTKPKLGVVERGIQH